MSRLSSLDCALNIVEELNRLEEATDKEAVVGSHLGLRIARNGLEITRVILWVSATDSVVRLVRQEIRSEVCKCPKINLNIMQRKNAFLPIDIHLADLGR